MSETEPHPLPDSTGGPVAANLIDQDFACDGPDRKMGRRHLSHRATTNARRWLQSISKALQLIKFSQDGDPCQAHGRVSDQNSPRNEQLAVGVS